MLKKTFILIGIILIAFGIYWQLKKRRYCYAFICFQNKNHNLSRLTYPNAWYVIPIWQPGTGNQLYE